MRLIDYLNSYGSASRLAGQVGVSVPTVSEWKYGKKVPDIDRCVLIEKATNGIVTRIELRPADWWRYWPELADRHPELVPKEGRGA